MEQAAKQPQNSAYDVIIPITEPRIYKGCLVASHKEKPRLFRILKNTIDKTQAVW